MNEHNRLAWRCRRGMLELDILLQGFMEHGYSQLRDEQRHHFVTLLELSDQELLDCLLNAQPPREEWRDVIKRIRDAITP